MRPAASAVVVALALMSLPSAVAGQERPPDRQESAICSAEAVAYSISPGLGLSPINATLTNTEPQPVECQGSVAGREVTGLGEVFIAAVAEESTCQQGRGRGRALLTLPTAEGPMEVVNDFTWESVGPTGSFTGPLLSGVFSFVPPYTGDCVSAPLTKVMLRWQGASTGQS